MTTTVTVAGDEAATLSETDLVELSCGIAGCGSNCCTKSAPIVLNPYEIARLCKESGLSYEDLLDSVDTERARAFPLVMLPRDPACHFLTEKGCRIHAARPLACRLFPLGRVFDKGRSHFVLPRRNVCGGLDASPKKTVADYLRDQDAVKYMEMADRWIEFVSDVEQLPLPDAPVTSVAFHLLVYSPDTPPVPGSLRSNPGLSLEERFLARLLTARDQLPRFLKI